MRYITPRQTPNPFKTVIIQKKMYSRRKLGTPQRMTKINQFVNYTSYAFRNCLREHGVHQSFSNPATPHDNAVAEAFFSVLKREDISHSYYQTREDLEKAVTNYIEFYNSMRPHRKLHNLSPNDFERSFGLTGI